MPNIPSRRTDQRLATRFLELKRAAGTHSPSIATLRQELPDLEIRVDACFLSNPYATDLFMKRLESDLLVDGGLRSALEFYPSQIAVLAEILAPVIGADPSQVFIGNGAIEIIQALLRNWVPRKILVPIPTFSSYYEFVNPGVEVFFHSLRSVDGFALDRSRLVADVTRERPDAVILINPNNPDGSYTSQAALYDLLSALRDVPLVIIDESFIHFAFEDENLTPLSSVPMVREFPNLVVIKSMSKDFGVAGIRAGYAVMDPSRRRVLTANGFLWNVNGLAEYFFRLYIQPQFQCEYEVERQRYIRESRTFYGALETIPGLRSFPTMANFALVGLDANRQADAVVTQALLQHGVYLRTASDKIGLEDGQYIRVAARSTHENAEILTALRSVTAT